MRFLIVIATVALVAVLAVCPWWLNVPRSVGLMAQGLGQQRQPVEFDIEFVGLGAHVAEVPVYLFYVPATPIFGITAHYWSFIAPLRI